MGEEEAEQESRGRSNVWVPTLYGAAPFVCTQQPQLYSLEAARAPRRRAFGVGLLDVNASQQNLP